MRHRIPVLLLALAVSATAFSGCILPQADSAPVPTVRTIRVWVEPMEWTLHPNVDTPVWAFCAEGDGVEPLHEGPCGVPGPTIRVVKGDLIRLTFDNTHSVPHTVHFHGWHGFMADMNGADAILGDMLVGPGERHTFEWTAEPAGTFIYHCHFQTPVHMDMGMYGAFIVEDPAAPAVDRDFVAVLDEWAVHDEPVFVGNLPAYNFFTINGRSFPTTQPWIVEPGARVRIHMVNAGFEFHAMHLHGHTPDSWEGVAGPRHAVPTDVREIAPGQSVVLDFRADREGVWLFHDHVVPRVTAASHGDGFGAYPRGMLTVLVVGQAYAEALRDIAPALLAAAARDSPGPGGPRPGAGAGPPDAIVVDMKGFAFPPGELRIPLGSTVTWVNKDPAVHTVTFDEGPVDSGDVAPGASWSHVFSSPGTYRYHCAPHAAQGQDGAWRGMVGTIVVEAAARG